MNLPHSPRKTDAPSEDFATLYHRAFADYKLRALWNVREVEHPTAEEAMLITRSLRVEGETPAVWRSRSNEPVVPLSKIQTDVLRLLAAHRDPESYAGGSTPLNRAVPRFSGDINVFHNRQERVVERPSVRLPLVERSRC